MLIKLLLFGALVILVVLRARPVLQNLRRLLSGLRDEVHPREREVRGRARIVREDQGADR